MVTFGACSNSGEFKKGKILLGVDVLLSEKTALVKGKKVGLITNASGLTSQYKSTIDVLHEHPDIELAALFGPEHGIRGDIFAGKHVEGYVDERSGLHVHSLYGKTRRPNAEMLKGLDVLIYDIQDIGSRAYTFIYTMAYAMEAAQEHGLQFIVLDRPNPLGGNRVEGNVLDPRFSSFVGLYPIPIIYGMTVGELAQFFNEEFEIHCDLAVVPMQGWRREMKWEDTGLFWIPTSPHIPHAKTALFEVVTGYVGELGAFCEGVGYTQPFELIGAPWMKGNEVADVLNSRKLGGVFFRPIYFRPYYFNFKDQECQGVQIHITDESLFKPTHVQIHILEVLCKLYPRQGILKTERIKMFDKVCGTDQIRLGIERGETAEAIIATWETDLKKFMAVRAKYLLYQ